MSAGEMNNVRRRHCTGYYVASSSRNRKATDPVL